MYAFGSGNWRRSVTFGYFWENVYFSLVQKLLRRGDGGRRERRQGSHDRAHRRQGSHTRAHLAAGSHDVIPSVLIVYCSVLCSVDWSVVLYYIVMVV